MKALVLSVGESVSEHEQGNFKDWTNLDWLGT